MSSVQTDYFASEDSAFEKLDTRLTRDNGRVSPIQYRLKPGLICVPT